ncbi:MAG: hypothetical protein IJ125_06390 [Atopobiaceae bacterium]|nr:hypothetical protein [Atopobiaceae bacterium]
MADNSFTVLRQSISVPHGACALRAGTSVLGDFGKQLRIVAGRPHKAFLLHHESADADVLEDLRRQLTDAGFEAELFALADEGLRRLSQAEVLYNELGNRGITSDDALVLFGNAELLAVGLFVGASWCRGMTLAVIPTTLEAATEAVTPEPLGSAHYADMVSVQGAHPNLIFFNPEVLQDSEETRMRGRATMVASSMTDSKEAIERLAGRCQALLDNDVEALCRQVSDCIKARGLAVSSSSPNVRQGVNYGRTFAEGLCAALGDELAWSAAYAEGLRFESRLGVSVAGNDADIDVVFAQDGILAELGFDELTLSLSAEELIEHMKQVRFKRSRRFQFSLPLGKGRVRLKAVEDDLLMEHARAFCLSRAPRVAPTDLYTKE